MPEQRQLDLPRQDVDAWNGWRESNPESRPALRMADLRGLDLGGANLCRAYLCEADLTEARLRLAELIKADLSGADLTGADLRGACLTGADLSSANLTGADLTGADLCDVNLDRANLTLADLTGTDLRGQDLIVASLSQASLGRANLAGADLTGTDLSGADLTGANLMGADLSRADISRADLSDVDLSRAKLTDASVTRANLTEFDLSGADLAGADLSISTLIRTNLTRANLTGCRVFGVSAWGVVLLESCQTDIVITPDGEPPITVDNLEVAQFVYLLLNNQKLRSVVDTITAKVVLILGRFSDEQKPVLDAIKESLRQRDYLPILFDFEGPSSRDVGETVSTLAHLARYIIADITDPRCIPQELQSIVPNLPSVPVQPLLRGLSKEYGMFAHFQRYPWVLGIHHYEDEQGLLESLGDIIANLEAKRTVRDPGGAKGDGTE